MGLENIEKNVWAVALRDIVYTKCPFHRNGHLVLTMNEEIRNAEITKSFDQILNRF